MSDTTTAQLTVHRPPPSRVGAGVMPTFDALPEALQSIARAMSDAARDAMREEAIKPLSDDRVATFDEACAVFLAESINAAH